MSVLSLSRHAGPVAFVAGGAFAAVDLGRLVFSDPNDKIAMMADPVFRVFNGAYFVAFIGLAVALIAVYAYLPPRAGRLGLLAFLVALVGTMTQGGNMWFDGFAVPWLAEVAPEVFTAEKTITLQVGALAAYLLFALGWALFGIAVLRARIVPPVLPLAIVLGGLIGFQSGLPPYGVPIGLAVAALGGWLIHIGRAAQPVPERGAIDQAGPQGSASRRRGSP
jgi:hypothetical protein